MNKLLIKFYTTLALLGAAICLAAVILFNTIFTNYYTKIFPVILFIFIAFTGGLFYLLWNDIKKQRKKFTQIFMIGTTTKILGMLTFLTIYLFANRENAAPFLISFLILYTIFIIFEIISLQWIIQTQKTNK